MWFITLENKQFVVETPGGFCRCEASVPALADLLAQQKWQGQGFTCSSNLDFPESAGLPEDFPAREVLAQAIALARQRAVGIILHRHRHLSRPAREMSVVEAAWVRQAEVLFAVMPDTLKLVAAEGLLLASEASPLDQDGNLDPTCLLAEIKTGAGKVVAVGEI